MIYQKGEKIYFATSVVKHIVLSTSKKGHVFVHSFLRFKNEVELIPSPSSPPVLSYDDYPVDPTRAFDLSSRYRIHFDDVVRYGICGTFWLEDENGCLQTLSTRKYGILGLRIKLPRYDTEAHSELQEYYLSIFGTEEKKLSEIPHLLKILYPFSAEYRESYTARDIEWECETHNFIILPQIPQYILFVVKCRPDELEKVLKFLRNQLKRISPLPSSKFRVILRHNEVVSPLPPYTEEEIKKAFPPEEEKKEPHIYDFYLHVSLYGLPKRKEEEEEKNEKVEVIKYPIIEIERLLEWEG